MSSYYNGDSGRFTPSWDALDASYEDDVLDQSEYQFANRDHILFCIDASESMHKPMGDSVNEKGLVRGKSPLHQALEAVVKIERSKVITGPADSVGVLLYNVDPAKTPSSNSGNYKPGTYVLQALRQISAEEIKRLIKILEEANDEYGEQDEDEDTPTVEPPILRETFPPCDDRSELNIADVLVTCNFLFRDGGTKIVGNKRVFLVTDNDDPSGSSNRAPAQTVFGDLTTYGVSINTYFIGRPGHPFDPRLYWNDILGREDDDANGPPPPQDGLENLAEVMEDLVIRQAPKRRQFSVPLKFGGKDGDIEIGVSGYALVSVQTKGLPKLVRMRGQAVEEVESKTLYTSAETGADLDAADITRAFQFGKESTVKNVLEPNWWESNEHNQEQQMYAEELLRLERERREELIRLHKERQEKGEAMDEDVDVGAEQAQATNGLQYLGNGRPKLVAKTRLQFSAEEIHSFKTMGVDPPQIKILGFQSPENLHLEDNVKHSYFIYPDETTYTGSTRTFTALLKSCIKLKRHALALCRFRSNVLPEFCVLVPQEETFNKEGGQEDPPGFHVIVLPFVDDLRDPPKNMTHNIPANDDEIRAMERLMRRLRFKRGRYFPDAYPNPALEYHQRQLQALAFDEDFDTELFDDKALPKYAGIHHTAGHLMKEWKRLVDEDERAMEVLTTGTKRHVVDVDEADLADIATAYKHGSLNKLKVQELKDYAKFHKISLAGRTRKAEIVDAIKDHLDQQSAGAGKKAKKA